MSVVFEKKALSQKTVENKKIMSEKKSQYIFQLFMFGYVFVAGFIGLTQSMFQLRIDGVTFGLRLIVLLTAMYLIFRYSRVKLSYSVNKAILAFTIFWTLYTVRVFWEIVIEEGRWLSESSIFYLQQAYLITLIPTISILILRIEDHPPIKILAIHFIVLIIITFITNTTVVSTDGVEYDTGRLGTEKLNPIAVGHYAVSVVIMFFWYFKNGIKWREGFRVSVFCLVSVVALYLLVNSGSRGPLVCLLVTALLILFRNSYHLTPRNLVIGVVLLSSGVLYISTIDLGAIIYRFGQGAEYSDYEREFLFIEALNGFKKSPIFGAFLESPVTNSYPHNIFVEALSSVGILGGAAVVIFWIYCIAKAFKLLDLKYKNGWVGGLYIQYGIGSLFSGAIYSNYSFWYASAILLAVSSNLSYGYNKRISR